MANIIAIRNTTTTETGSLNGYMADNRLAELLKYADNTQNTVLQFYGEQAVFLSHYVADVINDLIAFYNNDYKKARAQTTLIVNNKSIFKEDFEPEEFFINVQYEVTA